MPLSYGGGINNIDQASKIFSLGIEKICLQSAALNKPAFVSELVDRFGSSSIIVSLDIKIGDKVDIIFKESGVKIRENAEVVEIVTSKSFIIIFAASLCFSPLLIFKSCKIGAKINFEIIILLMFIYVQKRKVLNITSKFI